MAYDVSRGTVYAAGASVPFELRMWLSNIANVKAFGAVGDGIADDGPAFQRAFDYAVANRKSVYIPTPVNWYRIRQPLFLNHANGMVVFGDNAKLTTLYFDLSAGDIGLTVHNGHTVVFRDFSLRGSDAVPLLAVVQVEVDTTHVGDTLSSAMRWQNMRIIGGNTYSEYGVLYRKAPGSLSQMNDLSVWNATDIFKVRRAAVVIEDVNSTQHAFTDCKFTYIGRGLPGTGDDWSHYPTDEGYGVWIKNGTIRWTNGYMGIVKGSALRVDTPEIAGLVFNGCQLESIARILDVAATSDQPYHVFMAGNRYSSAYTNAPGAASEFDSLVIRSANAGQYHIINNGFGEGDQTGKVKFAFTNSNTRYVEIVGNQFDYVGADVDSTFTYPVGAEVEIYGNSFKTAALTRVGRAPVHQGW